MNPNMTLAQLAALPMIERETILRKIRDKNTRRIAKDARVEALREAKEKPQNKYQTRTTVHIVQAIRQTTTCPACLTALMMWRLLSKPRSKPKFRGFNPGEKI